LAFKSSDAFCFEPPKKNKNLKTHAQKNGRLRAAFRTSAFEDGLRLEVLRREGARCFGQGRKKRARRAQGGLRDNPVLGQAFSKSGA
jgi:hypothetical protein